ncbi:MAG: hypothetical protein ACO3SP_04810 [Ilumatobacteraceae bacterium]
MISSVKTTAIIVALALLTGCAPTTYDSSIATSTSTTPTSTEPTGSVEELLGRMSIAMGSLSGYIGPDQTGRTPAGKMEQLALIESLWSAVREIVLGSDPEAGDSLGRMVTLARTAVERNRPADADKAARFAGQVIDDYLERST